MPLPSSSPIKHLAIWRVLKPTGRPFCAALNSLIDWHILRLYYDALCWTWLGIVVGPQLQNSQHKTTFMYQDNWVHRFLIAYINIYLKSTYDLNKDFTYAMGCKKGQMDFYRQSLVSPYGHFHNFWAARSEDRQNLCSSETLCDRFCSSVDVKESVRQGDRQYKMHSWHSMVQAEPLAYILFAFRSSPETYFSLQILASHANYPCEPLPLDFIPPGLSFVKPITLVMTGLYQGHP